MPRLTKTLPQYRKHKASGKAIVTLDGKDFYLGPHGTKASKAEYDRLVGEWQANGRRLPVEEGAKITVTELCAAYSRYAKGYYVKNGQPTDELAGVRIALSRVRKSHGKTLVSDFGPLSLEAVRDKLIKAGSSRRYINQNIGRIRRMVRWGVARQLVDVTVYQSLQTLDGLKKGKTTARETSPVLPVSDDVVAQTIEQCSPVIADMIRFQQATGCRPGELFVMKPRDIDRAGDVWAYRPESHKMEHKGRERVIHIGPRGQTILAKYLLRSEDSYCFSRKGGKPFKRWNYSQPIESACRRAGVQPWAPNRLRHSRATEVRSKYGLEGAQVSLGHSQADVTQVYAERDHKLAAQIAREVG